MGVQSVLLCTSANNLEVTAIGSVRSSTAVLKLVKVVDLIIIHNYGG